MGKKTIKEILSRFPLSSRDQRIILERIYGHKTHREIARMFGLSPGRIGQIELKFWRILWGRSLAYEKYYKEKREMDYGVYKYRLYNPEKIHEITQENLSRRISEYDFPIPLSFRLYTAGIETIGQLIQKTESDLMQIRTVGPRRIEEIKKVLVQYGFSLKEEN